MNLDTKSWKAFRFGDMISEIYKAQAYKDEDLSFSKKLTEDSIPYVTRTDLNNGVKAFALRERLENIEKGNALVIGDTTATISYQKDDFIAGDHIVIVRTNWLNEYTGLFVMTLLKKESYRYSYGRAFKIDIIKETVLKLPTKKDGSPDWQFMESFIKSLRHKPLSTKAGGQTPKLDVSSWKSYRLGDLFAFQKGKRLTKSDMVPGNVNFLGAIDGNNGVREKIDTEETWEGNCITVNYNGSVGEAFFQEEPFWASDDVNVLYARGWNLNKYTALFLCTIIRQERYRFSYGRKWTLEKMQDSHIKLPATTNGTPDFAFMERYIKSLPYSDRI